LKSTGTGYYFNFILHYQQKSIYFYFSQLLLL